jgi:hypothetical protein
MVVFGNPKFLKFQIDKESLASIDDDIIFTGLIVPSNIFLFLKNCQKLELSVYSPKVLLYFNDLPT